jgi:hypothetical protein
VQRRADKSRNRLVDCPLLTPASTTGHTTGSLREATVNENFGPTINVSMPGYFGSPAFSVDLVTPFDSSCTVTAANFTVTGGTRAQLQILAWPIDYASCGSGMYVEFTARRSNDPSITAKCGVNVTVLQVTKAPVITDCQNRTVRERSIVSTLIGTPLLAVNPNGTCQYAKACFSRPFMPALLQPPVSCTFIPLLQWDHPCCGT